MDDHGDHAAGRLAHGNVHTGAADALRNADGGGDSAARGLDGFNGRAVGTLLDRLHTAIGGSLGGECAAVAPGRRLDDRAVGLRLDLRDRAVRVDDRFDLADRATRGRRGNIEIALLGVICGKVQQNRVAAGQLVIRNADIRRLAVYLVQPAAVRAFVKLAERYAAAGDRAQIAALDVQRQTGVIRRGAERFLDGRAACDLDAAFIPGAAAARLDGDDDRDPALSAAAGRTAAGRAALRGQDAGAGRRAGLGLGLLRVFRIVRVGRGHRRGGQCVDVERLGGILGKLLERYQRAEALLGGERLRFFALCAADIAGGEAVFRVVYIQQQRIRQRAAALDEAGVRAGVDAECRQTGDDHRIRVDVAERAVVALSCAQARDRLGDERLHGGIILCVVFCERRQRRAGGIRVREGLTGPLGNEQAVRAEAARQQRDHAAALLVGQLHLARLLCEQHPRRGVVAGAEVHRRELGGVAVFCAVQRGQPGAVDAERGEDDLRLGAVGDERGSARQLVDGEVQVVFRVGGVIAETALCVGCHVENDPVLRAFRIGGGDALHQLCAGACRGIDIDRHRLAEGLAVLGPGDRGRRLDDLAGAVRLGELELAADDLEVRLVGIPVALRHGNGDGLVRRHAAL